MIQVKATGRLMQVKLLLNIIFGNANYCHLKRVGCLKEVTTNIGLTVLANDIYFELLF